MTWQGYELRRKGPGQPRKGHGDGMGVLLGPRSIVEAARPVGRARPVSPQLPTDGHATGKQSSASPPQRAGSATWSTTDTHGATC